MFVTRDAPDTAVGIESTLAEIRTLTRTEAAADVMYPNEATEAEVM